MTAPVIIVSGFGRCGSSLTMQMLAAGGVPCVGAFPDFEVDHVRPQSVDGSMIDPLWFAGCQGRAVKVLDPHRARPPTGIPRRVIWCDRDPNEQAKSQVKFARLLMGLSLPKDAAPRLRASYRADEPDAICGVRDGGAAPMIRLRFERTLRRPEMAARDLADFLGDLFPGLDEGAMAAAVIQRGPACARGLEIETNLMAMATPGDAA